MLLQHSTLSNSGATITNSASNGSGSGLANQHQVLHVIIIKQKSEFYRLKRHATFHKRIQSKTEKISNAIFSVSQTTSSALSNERNLLMQIGLSSRSVGPLLDWVAVYLGPLEWTIFFLPSYKVVNLKKFVIKSGVHFLIFWCIFVNFCLAIRANFERGENWLI